MHKQPMIKVWKNGCLPPNLDGGIRKLNWKNSDGFQRRVKAIIKEVRTHGDAALIKFAKEFDKATLETINLRVTREEINRAYEKVTDEQISAIEFLKKKLETIEKSTLQRLKVKVEEDAVQMLHVLRPIQSVGCYVPGGKAAYPSSVVMTVVPAKVAGVPRVVVCSPPAANGSLNPLILVALDICEADEVYKVGGAQAIAAMAYGTESIKPVKKIVGPGNKYVTMAKILVSKDVAVDAPAGPTEILILADETANPRFIAIDMISQAEHGVDSIAGLITTSEELAKNVLKELRNLMPNIKRSAIVQQAISKFGFIIICETVDKMIALANSIAPEHIEIVTKEPENIADKIISAGIILMGPYSTVTISDYCIGTNHVLPTSGFGHVFSGLSALDFVRRVNIVKCSKESLLKLKGHAKVLAEAENLPNHYRAIEERMGI